MSNLKLIVSAFAIVLFTTASFANNIPNSKNQLRSEIASFINNIDFSEAELEEEVLYVHFMLNTKNEIIVLSTDNNVLDNKIKQELNYRTVKSDGVESNKVYTLPIRIKASSISS